MKGIACVILILGLLKFAQDAPDLFKTIFAFGGDLLKGMNLDPRGQLRNDFTTASKPIGKVAGGLAGAAGGLAAGAARGFRQARADYEANGGRNRVGRYLHTAGATLAGGTRGLVRGGRAGFTNSSGSLMPGEMFNQVMSGTEQGNIAAQMNSQHYRDGKSTIGLFRFGNNIATGVHDAWTDHVAEPWGNFIGNVSGRNTASEAAQMFATTKANNTAAMTATGTDVALGDLKNAKDEAKNKIREANALGMSYSEMLTELGMTQGSAINKAREILGKGYKVDGMSLDGNGNVVVDQSKMGAKTLQDIVDGTFKVDKEALLQTKFKGMNDENAKIIAEYNKETVDNLKDNLSLLGQDDVNSLIKGLSGNASFKDLGITTGTDSHGNMTFQHNGTSITGSQALDTIMRELSKTTDAKHLKFKDQNGDISGAEGAQSMMQLDALQTELKKVNDSITNRKALEEHQRSSRNRGTSSDSGSSSGGSSGSGGGN